MPNVIAITNQKGGCGKTTTSVNLSTALCKRNLKILLVDLDPQAHSTLSVGLNPDILKNTVLDLIAPHLHFKDALSNFLTSRISHDKDILNGSIQETNFSNLDILPSNILLAAAESRLARRLNRHTVLLNLLRRIKHKYDFIIIDCPPSLGFLTINALIAARWVIIPVQPHYFAIEGTRQLFNSIEIVRHKFKKRLHIMGILPTLYNEASDVEREVLAGLRDYFRDGVFQTVIKSDPVIIEASSKGEPIHFYAPDSQSARDYLELAEEVITHAR